METAKMLCLSAGEIDQQSLSVGCDARLFTSPRSVVQSRYGADRHGPLVAGLQGLMVYAQCVAKREEGWVGLIGQKLARGLDPDRVAIALFPAVSSGLRPQGPTGPQAAARP